MKQGIIIFFFIFLFSPLLKAGWVIREETHFTDKRDKKSRTVYVQDHFIKLEEKELITIIDLSTGVIRFYNPETKKYWEGKVEDYEREIASVMRERFLDNIKDYDDRQKKEALRSFDRMIRQLHLPDSAIAAHDRLHIQVTQTKKGREIAGYPTRIYMVWVNSVATEETWIAPGMRILPLPLLRRYYEIFNRITKYYEHGFHYQDSPKYLYMLTRGYPVRVREFGYGYEMITDVTRVKKKKLSYSVFSLPGNPAKVSLKDLNI